MRSGQTARSTSRTAEIVALIRDLAGFDAYAHHFVAREYRLLGQVLRRLDPDGERTDRFVLGLTDAVRTRHRWLDAVLIEAVASNAEQVVLLGSGFDARPWRFTEALGDRPVFLVDHPATAEARAARGPDEPSTVHRVDVLFDREDFTERLDAAGFDWSRPAVFIWEGVTMYLSRAVVESTLARIARRAAPGTRIAFDLVAARDRSSMPKRERLSRAVLSAMREPISPGFALDEMTRLVVDAGLHLKQRVPVREAPGGDRAWPDMYLVEAVVPPA